MDCDLSNLEVRMQELLKDPELLKQFNAYAKVYSDLVQEIELERYISGFRTGAKFSLDTFVINDNIIK